MYLVETLKPGTSGVLSPFGKIKGFYFNDSKEPDDYEFEFVNDLTRILKNKGVDYIAIKCDNKDDYYNILDKLTEYNKDCITVSGISKDKMTLIIENDTEEDADETENETDVTEEK